MPSESRTPRLWCSRPCSQGRACTAGADTQPGAVGGELESLCVTPGQGWPGHGPSKEVPWVPGCCWGPALAPHFRPRPSQAWGQEEEPLEQVSPSQRLPTPGPCGSGWKPALASRPGTPPFWGSPPRGGVACVPPSPRAGPWRRGEVQRVGPECVRRPSMGLWGRDGVWGPHLYSDPGSAVFRGGRGELWAQRPRKGCHRRGEAGGLSGV